MSTEKGETPVEKVTYVSQSRMEKAEAQMPPEGAPTDVADGAVAVYAPESRSRVARNAVKTAVKAFGWLLLLAALAGIALWIALWALPRLGVETKSLLDGFAGQFEERYGELLLNR